MTGSHFACLFACCCPAAVGCGVSPNYWVLIVCRMLVGVGEASFVALAAPFIGEGKRVPQWGPFAVVSKSGLCS